MQFSSGVLCFWLLATLPPQVLGVQIQDVISGSGVVIKVAKKTHARWVNLDFGGHMHGKDNKGDDMRPEQVKMQVCQAPLSQCVECTTQASCWRGGAETANQGKLVLEVPESATANYYAAEIWASCSSGQGIWVVNTWRQKLVNGLLKIFVDGSLIQTIDPDDHSLDWKKSSKLYTRLAIAKNTRVRVLFERSTAGEKASADIKMKASEVAEYVDHCMGVTNCLVSLGDASDSAFLFRNSNKLQLTCLKATSDGQRDEVSDHCNLWEKCVSNTGSKSKLEALLGAALTSRGSLAEGHVKLNDAEGCVDPSVEDPESWDCECIDEMTASCKGVDEECFHKILCENTNVCESWKGDQCAELSLAERKMSIKASQNKSAALMRSVAMTAMAIVDDRLDSALSGKCSQ